MKQFRQNNNSYNTDAQTLASIAKSGITSIESSIEALSHLIENLGIYKQCMIDSINLHLQAESADNAPKYDFGAYPQSHTLPGVIQSSQAFNLQNTDRTEQINALKEKALRQKRIYFRLVEKDSKLYFQALKGLQASDASFEEFLEILNNNIDLSLQPNRINNRNSRTMPSIKLTVDQKSCK